MFPTFASTLQSLIVKSIWIWMHMLGYGCTCFKFHLIKDLYGKTWRLNGNDSNALVIVER